MNTLRWILAIAIMLAGVGIGGFIMLPNGLRRFFGGFEHSLIIGAIPLIAAFVLAWFIIGYPAKSTSPEFLSFPVLLINEDKISEVCLNPEELITRPENQDHIIEQRFSVIDALGRQYRIENYRVTEPKPSTLSRVFSATVYSVDRFKTAFDLRLVRVMTRDEVIAQLRDRDWLIPDTQAEFAQLYAAYRADRFKEFGNSRDQPLVDGELPISQP